MEVTGRTIPIITVIKTRFNLTAVLAVLSSYDSITILRGFIKSTRYSELRYHSLTHPFLVLGYTGRIRPRTPARKTADPAKARIAEQSKPGARRKQDNISTFKPIKQKLKREILTLIITSTNKQKVGTYLKT